jgi:hypothetical protein
LKHNKVELERLSGKAKDRGWNTKKMFGTLKEIRIVVDMQLSFCTATSIRTRMDLLLAQFMLLRGEDRRHSELWDLVLVDALNEQEWQTVGTLPVACRSGCPNVRSNVLSVRVGWRIN